MLRLKETAELMGLKAEAWRLSFNDLIRIKLPALALTNEDHFVVIREIKDSRWVILADPAFGRVKLSKSRFLRDWNGKILVFREN